MTTDLFPLLWKLVVAGGGGAALVLLIIKFFGQRFIDASIARGMESLRHRNVREIEELKFDFQRDFDRRTRIVQIELDIIPKMWSHLLDATNKTKAAQARFRMHADLDRLTEDELIEWLANTKIPKSHQKQIVDAEPKDRNSLYSRADDIRLCYDARKAALDAREFLAINAILLPTELHQDLLEFSKLIDDAAFDAEWEAVHGRIPKEDRRSDNFWKNSDAKIDEIGKKVRLLIRTDPPSQAPNLETT